MIVVGVDCPGTFPMNTYSSYPGKSSPTDAVLNDGDAVKYMRSACLNCKDPVAEHVDLNIGIFGADLKKAIIVEANNEKGEGLLEGLDLKELKDSKKREKAVADVRNEKLNNRDEFLKEKSEIKGVDRLLEFFDTCINCHNCMGACPICYCKECLFESSVFDLEAGKYMSKSKGKGAFKNPTDSLLFHVTRFNHMILSCVQCGLCEQACPSNIPLMDIITGIADNAQKEFEYIPGSDPEAPIPMVVYREEEFQDVGE
jgi:formate dehydrogenase subunit beta